MLPKTNIDKAAVVFVIFHAILELKPSNDLVLTDRIRIRTHAPALTAQSEAMRIDATSPASQICHFV